MTELEEATEILVNFVDLFEGWKQGIFKKQGINWIQEPPVVVLAREFITRQNKKVEN